jgi:NAD(P)-dependent dehydrogenase (short-subunit alcohol dehydrogenase family)
MTDHHFEKGNSRARMDTKVILITGASSGIGKTCAHYLSEIGHRVYGACRVPQGEESNHFVPMQMDVDRDDLVDSGVQRIVEREGRMDVVVNCAGFGIAGSVEDTSIEEAKAQFETNFFGAIRVCKAVLPTMRRQESGLIVNISSIAGLVSLPFQGLYSASKFALEGLTEALRMEVLPFGIRVVLIEPGNFQTRFTVNRKRTFGSQADIVYRERFDKAIAVTEKDESNGYSPIEIAHLLERIIKDPSPGLRYAVGPFSERAIIKIKNSLSYKLYEMLMMRHFKVD